MSLLSEYSITPEVFDSSSFSTDETACLHMQNLKEVLMNGAIVRDLRDGEWKAVFSKQSRSWHRYGTELIRKIASQKRFRNFPSVLENAPSSDIEWCREALETHKKESLAGIVSGEKTAYEFENNPIVASYNKLHSTEWWKQESSVRLDRKEIDYMKSLKLILECSNSLMFIDPHIDPRESRYQPFFNILHSLSTRSAKPLIEIHRCSYIGSSAQRSFPDWKDIFENKLINRLKRNALKVNVYIWNDFHDRHLISNLIGISLPNGFDVSFKQNDITTWTRLDRKTKDDIQREFDESSGMHTLNIKFSLG